MKTYLLDIIPKIQQYSHKLDDITLLTNQHWVILDEIENSKTVYIFQENYDLFISRNGKVTKATWKYLTKDSILIDFGSDSYLYRHGFFDKNILALQLDGSDGYAVLINENNTQGQLNSLDSINIFLSSNYIINPPQLTGIRSYQMRNGNIDIVVINGNQIKVGNRVLLNGIEAPDGKYNIDIFQNINVRNGRIYDITIF